MLVRSLECESNNIYMLTAIINEQLCIGCGICLDACPFDAIIGAKNHMHTVISAECIGCKLCVSPCPVDCIDLVPIESIQLAQSMDKKHMVSNARNRRTAKLDRAKQEVVAQLVKQDKVQNDLQEILSAKYDAKKNC